MMDMVPLSAGMKVRIVGLPADHDHAAFAGSTAVVVSRVRWLGAAPVLVCVCVCVCVLFATFLWGKLRKVGLLACLLACLLFVHYGWTVFRGAMA